MYRDLRVVNVGVTRISIYPTDYNLRIPKTNSQRTRLGLKVALSTVVGQISEGVSLVV